MEDRNVKFKVNGRETSSDELHICIPRRYQDLFEGHNFPNMHILSMALMHASSANDARYDRIYRWRAHIYERDLMNTLKAE